MTDRQNLEAMGLLYVRGAEGKYYLEVPQENGESQFLEAEKGLSFQEVAEGRFMAVRDTALAAAQREGSSHLQYFKTLDEKGDIKTIKQRMKRQDALERQFQQMAIDRVVPGGSPDVEYIKDNKFLELNAEYQQAVREGRHQSSEFQPFNTYAHKLITRSGKIVRTPLKGEVGMIGAKILILEQGYGEENFSQVTENIDGAGSGVSDSKSGDG